MCHSSRSHGFSLIELVFFIIVLGIGFAGTAMLYTQAARGSVDPVVRKQVVAIAASLLEEIQLRAFTYCDPDDANVYTATSATVGASACAATVEAIGPEPGEATRLQYDNVNDYNGFAMAGISDIRGNAIAGLGQYGASVTVTAVGPAGIFGLTDGQDGLLIAVTATGPANVSITLHGYRFRYAPNSP